MENKPKALFRDAIGVFTAFAVVLAFITIGFLQFFANTFLGLAGEFDSGWLAAMLSLASAAMGYLIGKRDEAAERFREISENASVILASNKAMQPDAPHDIDIETHNEEFHEGDMTAHEPCIMQVDGMCDKCPHRQPPMATDGAY